MPKSRWLAVWSQHRTLEFSELAIPSGCKAKKGSQLWIARINFGEIYEDRRWPRSSSKWSTLRIVPGSWYEACSTYKTFSDYDKLRPAPRDATNFQASLVWNTYLRSVNKVAHLWKRTRICTSIHQFNILLESEWIVVDTRPLIQHVFGKDVLDQAFAIWVLIHYGMLFVLRHRLKQA